MFEPGVALEERASAEWGGDRKSSCVEGFDFMPLRSGQRFFQIIPRPGMLLLVRHVRERVRLARGGPATQTRVPHPAGSGSRCCSRDRYRMWLGRAAEKTGKGARGKS